MSGTGTAAAIGGSTRIHAIRRRNPTRKPASTARSATWRIRTPRTTAPFPDAREAASREAEPGTPRCRVIAPGAAASYAAARAFSWNCASSVDPVSAVTLEAPPWITVVTSSK